MASIFTKIIDGEIPCYKIAETEHYFSFLDINPVVEGHTLVVPKKEIDYIFDLDEYTLKGLIHFAKKVALAIDQTLGSIRTGIIVEGMEVPHAHIHLIPIYSHGQSMNLDKKTVMSIDRMQNIAELINEAIIL